MSNFLHISYEQHDVLGCIFIHRWCQGVFTKGAGGSTPDAIFDKLGSSSDRETLLGVTSLLNHPPSPYLGLFLLETCAKTTHPPH